MVMEKIIPYRPLSDMDTDGVYFDDYVREKLQQTREEEICHYSGLPSLKMYMKEEVEYESNHSS